MQLYDASASRFLSAPAPLRFGLYATACAGSDESVYCFGGIFFNRQPAQVGFRYRMKTNAWTAIPLDEGRPFGIFARFAMAVYAANQIHVLGGVQTARRHVVFDIDSGLWSEREESDDIFRRGSAAGVISEGCAQQIVVFPANMVYDLSQPDPKWTPIAFPHAPPAVPTWNMASAASDYALNRVVFASYDTVLQYQPASLACRTALSRGQDVTSTVCRAAAGPCDAADFWTADCNCPDLFNPC